MKTSAIIFFGLLVQYSSSRGLPEESVVSVYTPPSSDVYHQIANNIAERITSPIYRFLGINRNSTTTTTTTSKPWDKIEILDDTSDKETKLSDSKTSETRDVEELTGDSPTKKEKPEKITLYSNYLPAKIELNDTINEISDTDEDDNFGFDDDDDEKETKRNTSPFIYVVELIGSLIQLVYGGIVAYFSTSSSNKTN
ncbi:hypothetical protein KGM_207131 [Danaus plexippus plexippus]|uniref:Uncharacterized protein n=2 Tax=Danaus plexippus TaxID=13037 RepID=A0A212FM83_DANPL|nr:hypothetical protein KGM_207131 [Danaus plexippus plexippus]